MFETESGPTKNTERKHLLMPDAEVTFYPEFFPNRNADDLLAELLASVEWTQEKIKLYGKEVNVPRLTAWYGDPGSTYAYSGISMTPLLWTPALIRVKDRVETVTPVRFNSVLLNLYRGGNDSVSWHQDNEPELGENPVIASVSFGATRTFQLKHKSREDLKRVDIDLKHGSLLLMYGATQHFWRHRIPKTSKIVEPRINLTFRTIR